MRPLVRRIGQLSIALVAVVVGASLLPRRSPRAPLKSDRASGPALSLQGIATLPDTLSLSPFTTLDVRVQLLDLQARESSRTLVSESRGTLTKSGFMVPWQLTVPAGERSGASQLLVVISLLDEDHVTFVASAPLRDVTRSSRVHPGSATGLPMIRLQRVPEDATS